MVDKELLSATLGRALAFLPYGGYGTKKTLAIHTLPPPIFLYDWEGGGTTVLPWTARYRTYKETKWTVVTQEQRELVFKQVAPERVAPVLVGSVSVSPVLMPRPYIDIVYYDNMSVESYNQFSLDLGNFDYRYYNSLALDSMQEFAHSTQTFTKGVGKELEPMFVQLWSGAQERAGISLRRIRNYRDNGIFVYLTAAEQIDKDYITDPRSTAAGSKPEEPYSVKGTVNLPGKLANTVGHYYDILMHARAMGQNIVWVTQPESISSGGAASWEAKDRTGRVSEKYLCPPNIRTLMDMIYGEEVRKKIYASGIARIQAGS